MEIEECKKYLNHLLRDAQRVRSKQFEGLGDDDASKTVLEELEPWLFGRKCIIPHLVKCIEGEPGDGDVLNFSIIARQSSNLRLEGIVSKRKDPVMEEIFKEPSAKQGLKEER